MSSYFVDKSECSQHTIFPGVDIFTTAGKHMLMSVVEFQPGAIVEYHSHPHEQMGMVLEGRAQFIVGGVEKILGPGEMYCIPGGIVHKVVALDNFVKALDFFHPVREEYL